MNKIKAQIDSNIMGLALKVDYNNYYQSIRRPENKNVVIKKLPTDFYNYPTKKK
jgi:hypothetical protein